eukprot:m51a1_g9452 putative sorting nexin- (150) ;mRNA; f:498405-498945
MARREPRPAEGDYHEAEYIDITVTDPTKVNDGTGEFTRYKITTETTFPEYRQRLFYVYRRYKQFVSLRSVLKDKLSANPKAIKFGDLPSLPGNTASSLLTTAGRFDAEFVETRRKALEDFLNVVAHHSFFRFESVLHSFLQDEEWKPPK